MPEHTGPVGRLTARPALTVAAVLTMLAVVLYVVGLLGVRLPVPGADPAPAAMVGMAAMGLVAVVLVAAGVSHLLPVGPAAPTLRYERSLRFAESALGVLVLLAAAWVVGMEHQWGDITYIPIFGILLGVLAGLGLLVAVPAHVALVMVDPEG